MLKVDQNSVQARGPVETRFHPADFASAGEQIARGAADLGRGLETAAHNVDEIDQKYDTAAVKQADAEDLKQIIDIKSQVMTAQGFDAQTAVANARQQIADIKKQRMAALHNPRQRQMYSDVFDQRQLQLEETFGSHLLSEVDKADKNASVARAEISANDAVTSYGTANFDKAIATGQSEIASANAGAGPDVIALKQRQYRSGVLTKVVEGALADPERILDAQNILNEHAGELTPDDELRLRKQLNPVLEDHQTEEDAGWAVSGAPAPGEDPLAPQEQPAAPAAGKPAAARAAKAFSPLDIVGGKGRITETAAGHRARGSGNALDIAAPAGTAIHPPMSGKVIKNWRDDKGGWSLLIQHPNGYITGYAHMRSQSPMAVGAEVDATTAIGSVGATGHATGPHVHFTVREHAGGPKVDPAVENWSSAGAGTVSPSTPNWKEPGLTRFEAQENALGQNLSRLYERATRENWSQRRYQNAVTRVRQISGVQNELYNQQQEERWQGALTTVIGLGDGFTSLSQIPGYGLLDPGKQLALKNMADGNKKAAAGDGAQANGPTYFSYLNQMYKNPEGFKSNDAFLTDPNITNGERRHLFETREKMKTDISLSGRMDEAHSMAIRFLPKEMQSSEAYQEAYMQAIERRQTTLGRPLKDEEKLDVGRSLAVPLLRKGGAEGFIFENIGVPGARGQVDIPSTFRSIPAPRRQQIVNELSAKGLPHGARQVVEYYLQFAR